MFKENNYEIKKYHIKDYKYLYQMYDYKKDMYFTVSEHFKED
jgi:hypothetical protein